MKEGFKIKYFKNTIIGLKGILVKCHNKSFEQKTGVIKAGTASRRFRFFLDDSIEVNGIKTNSVILSEDDEIILIPPDTE